MGPPRIAQDAIAMAEHATHTDNPREPSAFDRERPHSRNSASAARRGAKRRAASPWPWPKRAERESETRDACVRNGDLGGARGSSQVIISVNPPIGIL